MMLVLTDRHANLMVRILSIDASVHMFRQSRVEQFRLALKLFLSMTGFRGR